MGRFGWGQAINPDLDQSQAADRSDRFTVALISLYDLENNAIRQLASGLRHKGWRVLEIYFKDWRNNRLDPPTSSELRLLLGLLRRERVSLVGISLRASAYEHVARRVCHRIRMTDLSVVVGGWHATVRPDRCLEFADAVCVGEADSTLPEFVHRLAESRGDLSAAHDLEGFRFRNPSGEPIQNPPPNLIPDLDAVPWRDFTHRDKWVIDRGVRSAGDPMSNHSLLQIMCSHGCTRRCRFCHNSFEGAGQGPRLRVRSVDHVLAEIACRREENPRIRRIRFDDEIFGLDGRWLDEFSRRYPTEVGLPFDILTEPSIVTEEYADRIAAAGARTAHMGIQSTGQVNRAFLGRPSDDETTWAAVQRLHARNIRIRYLVMVDIPGTTAADREELFRFFQRVPRPYDLYLFSLTHFPGSAYVDDMLATHDLRDCEVEGTATKTFAQYRVDLRWPRPLQERHWIAMLVLQASNLIPRQLLERGFARWDDTSHVPALTAAATAASMAKIALRAPAMIGNGEVGLREFRRWWHPTRLATM